MIDGIVLGLLIFVLILILIVLVLGAEINHFIKTERHIFPEIDLSPIEMLFEINNLRIWVNKYYSYRSLYEAEFYAQSCHYSHFQSHPNYFTFGVVINAQSRLNVLFFPYDNVMNEVDEYYVKCEKKCGLNKIFSERVVQIINELVSDNKIDLISASIMTYCIQEYDDNYNELRNVLENHYDNVIHDINKEGREKMYNWLIMMNNDKHLFLTKIILDIQHGMIMNGSLNEEFKMDYKQVFDEVMTGTFNQLIQNNLQKEEIKMIHDYLKNKQKMDNDIKLNVMINQANLRMMEGDENVFIEVLEQIE